MILQEGTRVTWKANRNRGYKAVGFVAYTEGDKVKIKIPWKGRSKGETTVWKNIVDVEIAA